MLGGIPWTPGQIRSIDQGRADLGDPGWMRRLRQRFSSVDPKAGPRPRKRGGAR
jgi:hypothetical protein